MHPTAPTAAPTVARFWPACAFSIAVHGSVIVFLAGGPNRAPRGGTDETLRSAGIVFRQVTAEGVTYQNNPEPVAADRPSEPTAPDSADDVRAAPQAAASPAQSEPSPSKSDAAPGADPGAAESAVRNGGSQHSGSPSESYAEVSVFGVRGKGNKFVYVFDRSASMEGPPLAAAKRQLIDSLKSLDNLHQFHIIFFNHRLRSFDLTSGGKRIAFGTERNKKLAANFVGGITADGGTDRFTALKQALAFRPDVVFFLTDADDPMSASEMAEIERMQSRIGTAICVIEFGRTATEPQVNFLIELARLSGGQYGYVNTTRLKP